MKSNQTTPSPFSVENNELNLHHRLLFELFDNVEEAVTGNREAEIVSTALMQFREYAPYHFGAEEALVEVKAYPEAQAHADHHLEFRAHLSELMAMPKDGEGTVRLQLLSFLRTWFQDHIKVRDKAYIPYLKDEIYRKMDKAIPEMSDRSRPGSSPVTASIFFCYWPITRCMPTGPLCFCSSLLLNLTSRGDSDKRREPYFYRSSDHYRQ